MTSDYDPEPRDREPMRARRPRPSLSTRQLGHIEDGSTEMSHEGLVAALRAVDGLVDVGRDPPNFHFRGRPFLHFHRSEEGTYADVRLGGDFEPVWASSPQERQMLLALVWEHVESIEVRRKERRRRR